MSAGKAILVRGGVLTAVLALPAVSGIGIHNRLVTLEQGTDVVVERCLELRGTAASRDLQVQLEGTENRSAVERARFFNATAGADRPPAGEFDFSGKAAPQARP